MRTRTRFRLAYAGLACVGAAIVAFTGSVLVARSDTAVVAPRAETLDHWAARVVTEFLAASGRGDTAAACRVFPDYLPCVRGDEIPRLAVFTLGSVSLADRLHPAVFATIDGIRGFFVLERQGDALRIISAAAD
jgi:hypothetical protein